MTVKASPYYGTIGADGNKTFGRRTGIIERWIDNRRDATPDATFPTLTRERKIRL
jgi:hypothetical protein